ncbi:MAG: ABC transporter ATP-binding protein [Rhodocyclales bacterium]|nr:ABC transporter ATP-binding protein [Rhodocyclales bacterium]
MSGLILDDVGFAYGDNAILERIALSVPPGQFVSLLGASGSGKSTLLRLIAGLQSPRRGRLAWNGAQIAGPGIERGVVFQDYALFPWLSMVDNIALAVGKAKPHSGKHERREEAQDYLRKVGLEAAIGKYPFEVSGGMQQRGAIARALALGSPLLLMDEPFGALDPVNRARLQDLLLEIWEDGDGKTRKTIVFVTHDVDEALYLGDRVVILGSAPGRIIADSDVPFARHRERRSLFCSAAFQHKREAIAETLAADMLEHLATA